MPKAYNVFTAFLFLSTAAQLSFAQYHPTDQIPSHQNKIIDRSPSSSQGRREHNYVEGQVIVAFREGTSTEFVDAIKKEVHLEIIRAFSRPNLYLMRICDNTPVETVMERLKSYPAVKYAEPNFIVTID